MPRFKVGDRAWRVRTSRYFSVPEEFEIFDVGKDECGRTIYCTTSFGGGWISECHVYSTKESCNRECVLRNLIW